jgi:hypothetical protein
MRTRMADDKLIKVYLNPLQFTEVDEPWSTFLNQEVSAQSVLDFMCTPGVGSALESILSRYKAISIEKRRLFAAPNEQRILDKLIWPLHNAKAGYMCGNYLGVIALCGMVAEMLAIFLFEINRFGLNKRIMAVEDQRAVFGSNFEKLGQDRRVNILHSFGVIDGEMKRKFDDIRNIRKRYLHLWSQDHESLPADAVKCFESAVLLVVFSIGQDIRDGKLLLNDKIFKYLEKRGIYSESD